MPSCYHFISTGTLNLKTRTKSILGNMKTCFETVLFNAYVIPCCYEFVDVEGAPIKKDLSTFHILLQKKSIGPKDFSGEPTSFPNLEIIKNNQATTK